MANSFGRPVRLTPVPLVLTALAVLVVSVGIALRIAGPIAVKIRPIEIPTIDIQIGHVPGPAEASGVLARSTTKAK